jgi:hypothetical protein
MQVIFLEFFSLNTFSGLDILYGLKNMCVLNFSNSTGYLVEKNEKLRIIYDGVHMAEAWKTESVSIQKF